MVFAGPPAAGTTIIGICPPIRRHRERELAPIWRHSNADQPWSPPDGRRTAPARRGRRRDTRRPSRPLPSRLPDVHCPVDDAAVRRPARQMGRIRRSPARNKPNPGDSTISPPRSRCDSVARPDGRASSLPPDRPSVHQRSTSSESTTTPRVERQAERSGLASRSTRLTTSVLACRPASSPRPAGARPATTTPTRSRWPVETSTPTEGQPVQRSRRGWRGTRWSLALRALVRSAPLSTRQSTN